MKTIKIKKRYCIHLALLLGWIAIGTILRFTNLELKPPWSDEWATLVFSLGNSFRTIPLNEIISLDTLLSPLRVSYQQTIKDTVNNLLTESTHPPLYFVLNHWWLEQVNVNNSLVSIVSARFFSALWGVAAIGAMFALAIVWFRSLIVAQLASALMAVSPFGVYLAQEARHYTLAILWIIASLACLVVACKACIAHIKLRYSLVLLWIIVNVLGVTTHYFFALALVVETLVLFSIWLIDVVRQQHSFFSSHWQRVYLAIIGTFIGCLPWFFIWRSIPSNQLTSWIYQENSWYKFYEPVGRILLWLITQVALLPVEGVSENIAIASGIILLGILGWLSPSLYRGYKRLKTNQDSRLQIVVLERFIVGAIAFLLFITYTVGADLSLSSRFQFFYFPGWLLFIAAVLNSVRFIAPKKVVILIALGICGSLTINHNLAFQKVERPDLVVPVMVEAYNKIPVVIAIQHYTHGQTGELMSLGWQFQTLIDQKQIDWQPSFFLDHQEINSVNSLSLNNYLKSTDKPLQLWLINYSSSPEVEFFNCITDQKYRRRATGYKYRLYNCSL